MNPKPEVPLTPPTARATPARARAARRTMDVVSHQVDVWEDFFDNVRIGLALADLTTRYMRINTTYAGLLGKAPEDLVGVPFGTAMGTPSAEAEAQLEQVLSGRRDAMTVEAEYVSPSGRRLWLLHGVSVVLGADGRPGWFAVSAQDVTERHRAEEELRDLTESLTERAVRDPLTGLANRSLVEERLRGVLARDARTGGTTGLLFLDLNGFKAVNDRHGHAVGDAVLKTVAARLAHCVRPSDTVARLGGDEFVVLAEGVTREGLLPLVGRLQAAVAEPVVAAGLTLNVGVSIGMAVSTGGEADPAGLMSAADKDMYAVKRAESPQR